MSSRALEHQVFFFIKYSIYSRLIIFHNCYVNYHQFYHNNLKLSITPHISPSHHTLRSLCILPVCVCFHSSLLPHIFSVLFSSIFLFLSLFTGSPSLLFHPPSLHSTGSMFSLVWLKDGKTLSFRVPLMFSTIFQPYFLWMALCCSNDWFDHHTPCSLACGGSVCRGDAVSFPWPDTPSEQNHETCLPLYSVIVLTLKKGVQRS